MHLFLKMSLVLKDKFVQHFHHLMYQTLWRKVGDNILSDTAG